MQTFLYRLRNDQYVDVEAIRVDEVRLDVLRHDRATQMIEESHVSRITSEETSLCFAGCLTSFSSIGAPRSWCTEEARPSG